MAQVGFIDSTGLGALIAGYRRAQLLQRPFAITGLQSSPRKVFKPTGLETVIPIYGTTAEACAHYGNVDARP